MQEITTWAEVLSLGFSAIVSGCTTMSEEYAHIVKTLTRMGTDLLCRPNKKGKNTHWGVIKCSNVQLDTIYSVS